MMKKLYCYYDLRDESFPVIFDYNENPMHLDISFGLIKEGDPRCVYAYHALSSSDIKSMIFTKLSLE